MLTIRLARTGRKKLAHYRVVAADSRRATTGKLVAQLGHYNPYTKELVIDEEKTQKYIDNGAQLSSRMVKLLQSHKGVKLPKWAEESLVVKAEKPKEEPEQEAGKTEQTEDTAEAPEEQPEATDATEADEDEKTEAASEKTESKKESKDTKEEKKDETDKEDKPAEKPDAEEKPDEENKKEE